MKIDLLQKVLTLPGILIGLTFHEYAHALVADKLGDKTPKFQGRLTLNPFVHIDIVGFLFILITGFGWAKPVETNPSSFKRRYKDDIKVSAAGPLANLLVAFIFAIILGAFFKFTPSSFKATLFYDIFKYIIYFTISINSMLFVFNLIPLPGLDGFHILRDLSPKTFYNISDFMYKYQLFILLIFVFVLGDIVIGKPSAAITKALLNLSNILFS